MKKKQKQKKQNKWTTIAHYLVIFFVALLPFIIVFGRPAPIRDQEYGISFLSKHAISLGLDSKEVYLSILEDLGAKRLRLGAYWDAVEPQQGQYDFSELDWQLDEAAKNNAKVLLAVGRKLPRWPECFVPNWATQKPLDEQNKELFNYLKTVVERYKNHPAVFMWQLENEPFVGWFGDCPKPNAKFLRTELALVRSISNKEVLITDSGELSSWRRAVLFADRFGTTMYRATWNPYFGYSTYPLPPAFYRFKARLWGLDPAHVVISELQMEPWPPGIPLDLTPIDQQFITMPIERLDKQLIFAKETGFGDVYFWGVEWWYWLKQNGHPEYWDRIKSLLERKQ